MRHQLQQGYLTSILTQRGTRRQQGLQRVAPVETSLVHQHRDHFAGDPFAQRAEGKQRMRGYRVALLLIGHAEAVKLRRAVVMNDCHHHAADLLLAHVMADIIIDGKPLTVAPCQAGFIAGRAHLRQRAGTA